MRITRSSKPVLVGALDACKLGRNPPPINFFRVSEDLPEVSLPIYGFKLIAGATTGFASPAQDYETADELNLTAHLVINKPATFLFPVGKDYDSMVDDGILPGSMLIIDRSLKIRHGSIVVASVDGEWVVKRLFKRNGLLQLHSSNRDKNYPPIEFKDGQELYIFGVVKDAINKLA